MNKNDLYIFHKLFHCTSFSILCNYTTHFSILFFSILNRHKTKDCKMNVEVKMCVNILLWNNYCVDNYGSRFGFWLPVSVFHHLSHHRTRRGSRCIFDEKKADQNVSSRNEWRQTTTINIRTDRKLCTTAIVFCCDVHIATSQSCHVILYILTHPDCTLCLSDTLLSSFYI